MTDAHHYSLDLDLAKRFTAIFDDSKTGVISKREFVNFARFMMVVTYLQTEDGAVVLEMANSAPKALGDSKGPEDYSQKCDILARENSELRDRMADMEKMMRSLQSR